jgi:hypothetical protein
MKIAKLSEISHKSRSVREVRGEKMPTAEVEKWEAGLTRVGCSIHAGTHPRWLKYENEVGPRIFSAADAELSYSATKLRNDGKTLRNDGCGSIECCPERHIFECVAVG